MAYRRIGQLLVELGHMDEAQVEAVLDEQEVRRELFGKIAQEMGIVRENQLYEALGEQFDMPVIEISELTIPPDVVHEVNSSMAQMYRIIPISVADGILRIAMCDPQNVMVLDELRSLLAYDVQGVISSETEIVKALDRYYPEGDSMETLIADLENDQESKQMAADFSKGKFKIDGQEESAPVRKLLNMVLLLAIKDKASDIHFEPFEEEFKIRVKADGVLTELVPPPRHLAIPLVTRIKVMANLDIAERRLPQDGRIELVVGGHAVDLRVSVLPTMFGECVVMRILDRSVVNLDLTSVGMDAATLDQFREIIKVPHGIVLVTGPTGSGKTTTLYSALSELNDIGHKLITTEDPVEYDIDGIVQVPIDSSIGVTFASCLRAILRQDPDIILVGEIRDYETAEIAIQASLTGHLVFSTLHTNDAPSTITRLKDMGVPAFMITATVEAIQAQRLVRRICENCKTEFTPTPEQLADLELSPERVKGRQFYRGAGCDDCNNSGYKGRIGIFELMDINDELRDMIMRNASADELREAARGHGMTPLREGGLKLIFDGVTTFEEVIRETVLEA
ncbi:Type IV fimbrial assembly protein PilB [Planctomycetales bacterium 10988]|nr:Type IV fimbrial assembly protein PilB [Planctomycetales bacterium 10988]